MSRSKDKNLTIVVPLFNEEKSIEELVTRIEDTTLLSSGFKNLILINNGSTDRTQEIASELAVRRPWIQVLNLVANRNYGGAITFGLRHVTTEYVGIISGDLQVDSGDLARVWDNLLGQNDSSKILIKGLRSVRYDGLWSRLVSAVYSALVRNVLKMPVQDVNGQPKIFHRSLLQEYSGSLDESFFFDTQLLAIAHCSGWRIVEFPVTFWARREGTSSWSGRRLKIYSQIFRKLLMLHRKLEAMGDL